MVAQFNEAHTTDTSTQKYNTVYQNFQNKNQERKKMHSLSFDSTTTTTGTYMTSDERKSVE